MVAAMWHDAPTSAPSRRAFDAQRFAWCSAAAILVFFSLSSSKLPAYIMPAIGAVALGLRCRSRAASTRRCGMRRARSSWRAS
jgi:4-amino-4-deoxy-L-arabinose transferase-like glycosyltransferase